MLCKAPHLVDIQRKVLHLDHPRKTLDGHPGIAK